MSINDNTTELQVILAAVHALPEAGSSGTSENLDDVLAEQEARIADIMVALEGKAGGDPELEKRLMEREYTTYANPTLTALGPYALAGTGVTEVDLPALTTIKGYAFYECNNLTEMVFPELVEIAPNAFTGCKSPATVVCPKLTTVPYNGFREFAGICTADFHNLKSIGANGFYKSTNLETLIIRTQGICSIASGTVLTATKILSGDGYVYVPRESLSDTDEASDYRRATNWSALTNLKYRALQDYTVDGTIYGALDPDKI